MERYISLSEVQRKINKAKQRIRNHCLDGAVAMDYVDIILDNDFKSDNISFSDVRGNIHGEWKESDDKFKTSEKFCSECGTDFHIAKANEWKFLYCPFCGAKMKEF